MAEEKTLDFRGGEPGFAPEGGEKTFASLGREQAIAELFEGSGYAPFRQPLALECEKTSDKISQVISAQRLLIEGTDFSLVYFPLKHLGYKSVVSVCAELYAALAAPRSLSVTLGVSAKLDFKHIRSLWDGVLVACREFSVEALSLDLVPSRNGLTIGLAAQGARLKKFSRRSAAQSKDLLCVSGSLGSAYLGQQVLEKKSGELDKYKMMVGDYLKPELSAQTLHKFADAGIVPAAGVCVSRGLADAALRLSRESGLGVKIYADKIPFEGNSFALGKELDIDPLSAAMNGGDDFRLLFVIPISDYERFRVDFQTYDIIGHLALTSVGTVLVTPDSLEHPLSAQGW